MFVDFLEETGGLLGVVQGAVEQGFGKAFDEGKRGAQFVADVADEFGADVFQFLEAGDVVENKQLALLQALVVADDSGVDLPAAAVEAVDFQFGAGDVFFALEAESERGQFVPAEGLHDGLAVNIGGDIEELLEGLVDHADATLLI